MKRIMASLILLLAWISPFLAEDFEPGETILLAFTIVNGTTGAGISGESPTVAVYRSADGYYLDWTGLTFKASGWTTKNQSLTEEGSTARYLKTLATTSFDPGQYLVLYTNTGANAAIGTASFQLVYEIGCGTGSVAVDEDYPTNDIMLITDGTSAIQNAYIRAYTAADYTAGRLTSTYVKGYTMSDVNGAWQDYLFLDPGSYTIVVYKQGYKTKTYSLTVTAP